MALLIGGIITISPILNSVEKANAKDSDITATSDTPPTISINLAAGDASANRQTPAKVGEIAYRTDVFTVGGTGMSKYVVSLNTPAGKTGELVGKSNPYATVGKVADNTATADFAENTWGYAITNDTTTEKVEETLDYKPVPSGMDSGKNSVEIASRTGIDKTTTVADSYKIAFAANFGKDLPADDYMADVYLSVVASPQATISSITTMQEMDSNVCAESFTGETKQLEDIRDRVDGRVNTGKKYWVAKLEDGNCWMTQNLDYDLSTGKALTSADSDVISNWTPKSNTKTGNINSGWSGTQTEVQSWDPGTYYYKYVSATDWTNCGGAQANMSGCLSMGNWTTTAPATEGEHYHVGNYYSWNAATAETGGSITSGQASSSICPKGWRLPTSNGTTADFGKLMGAYGLRTDGGSEPNVDKVRLDPMYFIPAGSVNTDGLDGAGLYGYYWSSTPNSNGISAYGLSFYSGDLNPSNFNFRYGGFSIRCVAK